jgi:hypothetical protein
MFTTTPYRLTQSIPTLTPPQLFPADPQQVKQPPSTALSSTLLSTSASGYHPHQAKRANVGSTRPFSLLQHTNLLLHHRNTPYAAHSRPQRSSKMAPSIFQRKRDLVYFVFFLTHLPVMLGEFLYSFLVR